VPYRDPAQVNLAELRVAFFTDNGTAAADGEVAGLVRRAAAALASVVRSVEESRPACLAAAYDLEMKLIGPDGGDGLRDYLRELGSSEVHPLLTAWLDKLEPYRTDLAGLARYWAELDAYRAEMTRFLRHCDVILCPATSTPHCLTANPSATTIFAASATPWPSTLRGGRPPWCDAASRAQACPSRCRWRLPRGAKMSHCVWHSGWKEPSAAGSPPSIYGFERELVECPIGGTWAFGPLGIFPTLSFVVDW